MKIRDRIKELRRVPASQLAPSPSNWRTHPKAQLDALRGMLAEIGFAGAALARELPDGSLELIDGHARTEISGDALVPVLVLDVNEDEAKKILATFDPLGAMATADTAQLDKLLQEVQIANSDVAAMLTQLASDNGIGPDAEAVQMKELDIKDPPKMAWVLIGIPIVRFAEINQQIELIAKLDNVFVETTVNDG